MYSKASDHVLNATSLGQFLSHRFTSNSRDSDQFLAVLFASLRNCVALPPVITSARRHKISIQSETVGAETTKPKSTNNSCSCMTRISADTKPWRPLPFRNLVARAPSSSRGSKPKSRVSSLNNFRLMNNAAIHATVCRQRPIIFLHTPAASKSWTTQK